MARYKKPSIDELGGITAYLNATAEKHNGNDAEVLKKHWNWGKKPHMSINALCLLFGVKAWDTMDDWINRLHEEARIKRPR